MPYPTGGARGSRRWSGRAAPAWLTLAVVLVAATISASEAAAAEPTPGPKRLAVYGTGDTDGAFARPRCRQSPILTTDQMAFARQSGYFRRFAERAAEQTSTFEPLALHLGDAVFPGPLGRFLLQSGEEGGTSLAQILERIPFASVTVGNQEMGMSRSELLNFVEGVQRTDLPLRGANITCTPEGGAEALCDLLGTHEQGEPYQVVERQGVRILLVSVLDPAIQSSIALSRLSGLELLDPTEMLNRELPEYRRRVDPDLVFVQFHAASSTDVDSLVETARRLDGIDAMFTNKQLGDFSPPQTAADSGYVRTPETGTYILPTGRSPNHASLTELQLEHTVSDGSKRWAIRDVETTHVDTSSGPVDPTTAELLWSASRKLCREWGRSIRKNAPLERAFDYEALQRFVLNVMRFSVEAEVALANEGAFLQAGNFPIRNHLTQADVYTILPYHNPLVLVRVRGAELERLADDLGGQAVATGLTTNADGEPRVNGRSIRSDRIYTVATNQYVADGGDGILAPSAIEKRRTYEPGWSGEPPAIADVVAHFVETGEFARRGSIDDRLSPAGNFPDLHRRLLWDLVGSTNLSYNQVAVTSPQAGGGPAYDQSQLNVQSTAQINLEGSFQANADSLNHGLDHSLLLQYATSRFDNDDRDGFQETRDLIRAISRYKYAGFRSRLGGSWWVPMPTGELQAETEFDRPDQRDWHKVEMTGIVGSTFQLFDPFELRVGLDLRRDLNNPTAETVYGVTAGYSLDRLDLVEIIDRPIRFESEFEYFFNNPYTDRIHELRTTSRVFYSVFDQLNVTSTFSMFMYRTATVGEFGRNTEFTIGLNYLWDESIQAF